MEKIVDEVLIRYLNDFYTLERKGKKLKGIEAKDKAWFINKNEQVFVLCPVDDEDNWHEPRIFVVGY